MEEIDRQRSENDRILLEGMEKRNLAKQEEENTKAKVFSKPGTSKAPDEEAKDLIFFQDLPYVLTEDKFKSMTTLDSDGVPINRYEPTSRFIVAQPMTSENNEHKTLNDTAGTFEMNESFN